MKTQELIPTRTNVEIMADLTSGTITVEQACDQLFGYLLHLMGEKPLKGKIEYIQPRPDANKMFIGMDGKRKTPVLEFVIPPTAQPHYPALRLNYEVMRKQAAKGMLTERPLPKDNPTLHMIAAECGFSLDRMAEAIKGIAKLIDDDGNKGMSTGRLQREDVGINVKWLSHDYPEAWTGIIFYNEERSVWQCRKNPFWLKVWCQRYADPGSDCEALAAKEVQQKLLAEKDKVEEAKLPKREAAKHVQGEWDQLTTRQVAERYCYAQLMSVHEHAMFTDHRSETEYKLRTQLGKYGFLNGYASLVWEEQQSIMWAELNYRSATGDDEATRYLHNNKWFDELLDADVRRAIYDGNQLPPPYFKQPNEVTE